MAEYIERAAAISVACKGCNKEFPNEPCEPTECHIQQGLFAIPAADVVEVRHEVWKLKSEIHRLFDDVDEEFYVECPLCKRVFYVPSELTEAAMLKYAKEQYPYCHCGAKMDGKGEVK